MSTINPNQPQSNQPKIILHFNPSNSTGYNWADIQNENRPYADESAPSYPSYVVKNSIAYLQEAIEKMTCHAIP